MLQPIIIRITRRQGRSKFVGPGSIHAQITKWAQGLFQFVVNSIIQAFHVIGNLRINSGGAASFQT